MPCTEQRRDHGYGDEHAEIATPSPHSEDAQRQCRERGERTEDERDLETTRQEQLEERPPRVALRKSKARGVSCEPT